MELVNAVQSNRQSQALDRIEECSIYNKNSKRGGGNISIYYKNRTMSPSKKGIAMGRKEERKWEEGAGERGCPIEK